MTCSSVGCNNSVHEDEEDDRPGSNEKYKRNSIRRRPGHHLRFTSTTVLLYSVGIPSLLLLCNYFVHGYPPPPIRGPTTAFLTIRHSMLRSQPAPIQQSWWDCLGLTPNNRPASCIWSTRLSLGPQQLGTFEDLVTENEWVRRRVWVENWVGAGPIPFDYAWKMQRDVLLQGHLNRLKQKQLLLFNHQKKMKDHNYDEYDETTKVSSSFVPLSPPSSSATSTHHHANEMILSRNEILTSGIDTIILLEHEPIYTLGTGSDEKFILQQQQQNRMNATTTCAIVPTIRMDRGGEVTYHGPGQLTVYPILDLRQNYKADIHWYVRALEEAVIVMMNHYIFNGTVMAYREPDITGVWINGTKVAAVGIKCKQWITQHGVAINILEESLPHFNGIVPCGLEGRTVGCLNQYLPHNQQLTMPQASFFLQKALQDVFQIQLVSSTTTATSSDYDDDGGGESSSPSFVEPPDLNDFFGTK